MGAGRAAPLGTSLASWWDSRLVELHNAIQATVEPPPPSPAVHEALRRWAYTAGHNEQGVDAAADRMYKLVARDVLRHRLTDF